MSGRYERKKPQNQSTGGWKKTVLIVVLVIVVLIAALVVAGVVYYNSMLNKMNQVQVPTISRTEPTTDCLLYTSPSPRDRQKSRMPSSA